MPSPPSVGGAEIYDWNALWLHRRGSSKGTKRPTLSARSQFVRLCRRHLPELYRAVGERSMERSRYLSRHARPRAGIERLFLGIGVHDPAELLPFRAVPAL